MSALPTLQSLALYAREHFGEDGYPFEESIPSSFDLVVGAYADEDSRGAEDAIRDHACAVVQERLSARPGFAPVGEPEVGAFVQDVVTYLHGQFAVAQEARRNAPVLSHLFWGNLVEARVVYGPLRHAACSCGYVMTGRDEEDLYALVRRHLWGQTEPERHHRANLPETTIDHRLVSEQDLVVESSSSAWRTPVPAI
jgi:hypothetical protein